MEQTSVKKRKVVPPDGGWGWMVVLGVSICNFSTRSIEPSFGLLFGDLLSDLQVETTGAAVIMSVMDATINFSGILVGPLMKTLTYRKLALLGASLNVIGLISTTSASSMTHIIITYSIIRGLGAGLATSSCLVTLNNFFLKKRGTAVGLAMAGTAVGFMLMPQAVQLLLKEYGFNGSILVLSAICLHAVVGAALLQPVEWHIKKPPVEQADVDIHLIDNEKEDENGARKALLYGDLELEMGPMESLKNCDVKSQNTSLVKNGMDRYIESPTCQSKEKSQITIAEEETFLNKNLIQITPSQKVQSSDLTSSLPKIGKQKSSIWNRVFVFMDFDLLKDPIYLNIVCGASIFFVAEVNFKLVIPFFMSDLGYTKSETAFCLSIMAVSDLVARVVLPPICDRFHIRRRMMFLISAILLGISRSILAEQTSYLAIMITIFVSGLFRGATLINVNLSVPEHCTLEKLPSGIGLFMVTKGLFMVTLGPVVGVIRDVSQSYPVCIHFQTLLIFICCLAWGIEFIIVKRRKTKETKTLMNAAF